MEGDLLEVFLDEIQYIWRIFQVCQFRGEGKFLDLDIGDKVWVQLIYVFVDGKLIGRVYYLQIQGE